MHCKSLVSFAIFATFIISTAFARCGNEYQYARSCTNGPQPGATSFSNMLKRRYGGTTQIYNCRNVRGGSTKSLHAEGRAIDYFGNSKGAVFNMAQGMGGVQEVIYNRQIWTKNGGVKRYNGENPHTDHVHVGLNWCGAKASY